MSKIKRKIYLLILIQIIYFPILSLQAVNAYNYSVHEKKNVLVIHSYHQGFSWTDAQHHGIVSNLAPEDWTIYVEYLDSYRNPDYNSEYLYNKIITKYSSKSLDAIIVTDNAALEFINTHREKFSTDVPLLFSGINVSNDYEVPFNSTGIFETMDNELLFEWVHTALPRIENIIVVGENTSTANRLYEALYHIHENCDFEHNIIPLLTDTIEEQITEIKTYSFDDTAIYVAGAFQELNHGEYASYLETQTNMFTFTTVRPGINDNVIGGQVIDPLVHGQVVSSMLLSLASGTSIENITPITEPLNEFVFNYYALEKYGIATSSLPNNSIILNEPSTEVTIDRFTLNFLYTLIGLFIIIIGFISYIHYITTQSNKEILAAKTELQEVNMDLEAHTEELIASQEELDHHYNQLKQSEEKLFKFANYDQLTGFYNQHGIGGLIDERIAHNKHFAVICLIFTHLDTFAYDLGYDVYEKILITITELIKETLGTKNYSYGIVRGNIFTLVCDNTINMLEEISNLNTFLNKRLDIDNLTIQLNPKFGIVYASDTIYKTDDFLSKSNLTVMSIPDDAKEQIAIYDSSKSYKSIENKKIQLEIEEALKSDQFITYLQPKYKIDGTTIVGYEILIRWQLPDGTIRYPDDFIDLAERTGQILEIDYYIIDKACQLIRDYNLLEKNIHIAINLSSRHFENKQIIDTLNNTLDYYQLPKDCLELEITETSIMTNIKNSINQLMALKELGYHLSIDDLGTGYSSLSYLRDFPVSKVKIDKSFIQLMPDTKNQIIVDILIKLCKRLGYKVVIEGVETKEQWEILKAYQPDELQGYLFSKPLPVKDILSQ